VGGGLDGLGGGGDGLGGLDGLGGGLGGGGAPVHMHAVGVCMLPSQVHVLQSRLVLHVRAGSLGPMLPASQQATRPLGFLLHNAWQKPPRQNGGATQGGGGNGGGGFFGGGGAAGDGGAASGAKRKGVSAVTLRTKGPTLSGSMVAGITV